MRTKALVVFVAFVTTVALSLGFAAANRTDGGTGFSLPRFNETQSTPIPATATATAVATPEPMPSVPPELETGDFETIEVAKKMLAKMLGILEVGIQVAKVERLASSDGIPVPETQVTLEVNGQKYPFRCRGTAVNYVGDPIQADSLESPWLEFTPPPLPGGETPVPETPVTISKESYIDQAKADLARKTGTAVSNISTVSAEAIEWSDTSLGVPRPGEMYAQIPISGYKIILKTGSQSYEYHAGAGRIVSAN